MQPEYIMKDVTDDLDVIAAKIDSNTRASDELLVEAAQLLAATKARFDSGEIIQPTWRDWCQETLCLGESRICALLRIGQAEDPLFELRFQRETNARRQAEFRARRATALGYSLHAQRLIDWAKDAPAHDVERVVDYISTLPSALAGQRPPRATSAPPARRLDYDAPRRFPARPKAPVLHNAERTTLIAQERTAVVVCQTPDAHPTISAALEAWDRTCSGLQTGQALALPLTNGCAETSQLEFGDGASVAPDTT